MFSTRSAARQVLGNFITVMRLFSTVRPPSSAAVLELRRQQQGAKGTELQLRRDQARRCRTSTKVGKANA